MVDLEYPASAIGTSGYNATHEFLIVDRSIASDMEIYKGVREYSTEYVVVSVGIRFPDKPVGVQAWHTRALEINPQSPIRTSIRTIT